MKNTNTSNKTTTQSSLKFIASLLIERDENGASYTLTNIRLVNTHTNQYRNYTDKSSYGTDLTEAKQSFYQRFNHWSIRQFGRIFPIEITSTQHLEA